MKRILCMLLVAVMALTALTSCGSTLEGDEKGAIIEMYISTMPDTFDPAVAQVDADVTKLLSLMYMPLTVIKSDGSVGKGMAKSWGGYYDEIYNEHKMYFTLYNTGWSDGRTVTADDFVFAWKRILDPDFDSPYAALLYPIKNAKAVKAGIMTSDDLGIAAADDTRLEITFENDYDINLFAETVSNIAFAPLREDKITSSTWTSKITISDIMSNGQFALRSYNNNKDQQHKIEFDRNANYRRDVEDDALDEYVIPYKIVINYAEEADLVNASNAYDNKTVNYLAEFNPETYAKYSNVKSKDALAGYACYFNTRVDTLSEAKVRKALSVALDRTKIAEIASCGAVAAEGFVPTGVFYNKKGSSFRKTVGAVYNTVADVAAAEKLLDEAGVRKGKLTLTYVEEGESEVNTKIAEYVASVWEELGFSVSLEEVKWPTSSNPESGSNSGSEKLRKILNNESGEEYEVLLMDTMTINAVNALGYLAPFAKDYSGTIADKNGTSLHSTGFDNADYNALVEKAVMTSDRKELAELCKQIEAMLAEQCPATALVFYKNSYLVGKKLSGTTHYYNGAPGFAQAELEGWRKTNANYEGN